MKKTIICLYFFAFLLLPACSQHRSILPGKIYDHVTLKKDSSVSFAIYLPQHPQSKATLAFVFFDPHGSGAMPLRLYSKLADTYGIILIGNNNSSNNTDMSRISADLGLLMQEIRDDYKIEDHSICFWGFSGGAKVALYNAGNNNQVGYCIYGGSVADIQNSQLELLGFNGKQDMNYTDLLGFAAMQKDNPHHFQIAFTGKHAWPDSLSAENAFRWFLLRKMQKQEIDPDRQLISSAATAFQQETEKLIKEKQWVDALACCNKALNFLNGLCDLSYFSSKQKEIAASSAYLSQAQALQQTFTEETKIKEAYQDELFSRDTLFWKKEIDGLWQQSKTDNSGMYQRLLGFLSLASYSIANRAFQGNDLQAIEHILYIYHYSDPENPEQAFMRAKLYVLKNQHEQARLALQEAIRLGIDKNRIYEDVLLRNLEP